MSKLKGDVRTSQLVLTYGVGALVALGDESFVVTGLDYWTPEDSDLLHEPRLERVLGVNRFYRPNSGKDTLDIPVRRFPNYYHCPECHRLDTYGKFGGKWTDATCLECPGEPSLVPSRFVTACERGHIDDFPFFQWAHRSQRHREGARGGLRLVAGGMSAGLADITVSCGCGASETMEGALGKKAMQAMGKCKGRRPWLEVGDDSCDALPRTVQRGASNVWFSVSRSAISIPPWSDGAFRVLDRHWTVLKVVPEVSLREVLLSVVPKSGDYDVDDLLMATLERRRQESGEATEHSLKEQEYEALRRGRPERDRTQEFVCVPATAPGTTAGSWFPMIQQVTRLREVRALQGFTRLSPPGGSAEKLQERMAPLSQSDLGWLPAIEVTGEGVYFDLASTRLSTWEQSPLVEQRLRPLIDRHKKVLGVDGVDAVTPRKVLLHTLAHVLIDQWALECGYPNASLAERLYVSAEMAGFLVYTATTDSAGSLGGVVAMTENGRLDASLREALQRIAWCSADPLCIEAGGHGVDSLNLAACHSCVLLPETSCEERNLFLDRAVLVGTLEDPDLGYFADLVRT